MWKLLSKKMQENTQKKMLTFEKIKEKFQAKFFTVVKVFHCLPKYLKMLFNYKVINQYCQC